jgi:dienelactone hydrolase
VAYLGQNPGMRRVAVLVGLICLLATGCGTTTPVGQPWISVTAPVALWDTPVGIGISGLRPGQDARLRAAAEDYAGTTWQSMTDVHADRGGRVDLRGDAAMRVLSSMQPAGGTGRNVQYVEPSSGERVRLTLIAGSRAIATTDVTRRFLAQRTRVALLRPADSGVYGDLLTLSGADGRKPGILLFGGSEGGLSVLAQAALLANHGYPTLALAYFAAPGLPHDLHDIPLEYFARALRLLARQPGVDPSRLVVMGVSRGSEAAQLLGVHYPHLVHAVVALVPSNTPVCGIPPATGTNIVQCIGAAWTLHGTAIRYSSFPSPFARPQIPDERIHGPILLDCGGRDTLWPSCPMAHAIEDRLRAHHFAHPVTLLEYPAAGHAVGSLLPYEPMLVTFGGGTVAADQLARADGWPRLLEFLHALRPRT